MASYIQGSTATLQFAPRTWPLSLTLRLHPIEPSVRCSSHFERLVIESSENWSANLKQNRPDSGTKLVIIFLMFTYLCSYPMIWPIGGRRMLEVTAGVNIPFSGCRTRAPSSIRPPLRLQWWPSPLTSSRGPHALRMVMTRQLPETWNSSLLSRAHHLHSE